MAIVRLHPYTCEVCLAIVDIALWGNVPVVYTYGRWFGEGGTKPTSGPSGSRQLEQLERLEKEEVDVWSS